MSLNSYILSKRFYQNLEQNPDMQLRCRPSHISVYFRIIEIQNQIGWQTQVIGLPTESLMHYACLSSAKTYYRVLQDLESWGLFKTLSHAQNQFTSRKITFVVKEVALDEKSPQENSPYKSPQPKSTSKKTKYSPQKPPNSENKPKYKPESEKYKPENTKTTATATAYKEPAQQYKATSARDKTVGLSVRSNTAWSESEIEKIVEEHFGSQTDIAKNTTEYEAVRQEWQNCKAQGRLQDLAAAESTGFALQEKISLRVRCIRELIIAFLIQRSTQGKPLSTYTFRKLLSDLEQYSGKNILYAKEILEKSLLNGWSWVYPLSRDKPHPPRYKSKIPTDDYNRYCSNPKLYEYIPPSRR